jgi:hypothetical protein
MLVHNISDRPNTAATPSAICIGNVLIRPGKFAEIPDSDITPKVQKMHGSHIWIGKAPHPKFAATSKGALRALSTSAAPMTLDEARAYLNELSRDELLALCSQISPSITFARAPGAAMLAILLSRALFQEGVDANPESFFWLRRWTRHGDEYQERD